MWPRLIVGCPGNPNVMFCSCVGVIVGNCAIFVVNSPFISLNFADLLGLKTVNTPYYLSDTPYFLDSVYFLFLEKMAAL